MAAGRTRRAAGRANLFNPRPHPVTVTPFSSVCLKKAPATYGDDGRLSRRHRGAFALRAGIVEGGRGGQETDRFPLHAPPASRSALVLPRRCSSLPTRQSFAAHLADMSRDKRVSATKMDRLKELGMALVEVSSLGRRGQAFPWLAGLAQGSGTGRHARTDDKATSSRPSGAVRLASKLCVQASLPLKGRRGLHACPPQPRWAYPPTLRRR